MITNITLYHVQLPMKFTFKTAKGEVKVRDTIVIRIEDDKGHIGYGECVAFVDPFYTAETVGSCWHALKERYLPTLLGAQADPSVVAPWAQDGCPMTVAAVENALFHVKCASLGVNTVEYVMGQPLGQRIPMGVVIGDIPLDQMMAAVTSYVDLGCERIKLKVSPEDGYERVALVRSAFPKLTLAVDGNQSYTYDDLEAIQAYDAFHLACLEEPFQMESLQDYYGWKQRLGAKWNIGTNICLDESILSFEDLVYAHRHGLLDALNVKVGRLGGLRMAQQAIDYCRNHGIGYWIGSMVESSISKLLHVQLAALGDAYMAGDLSDSLRYFHQDLTNPALTFTDGYMTVPNGVGLGATVQEVLLEQYCVAKETWIYRENI